MSGSPLLKHDTLFKLGLLSGEMQSLILSVLLQKGGKEEERSRKKKGERADIGGSVRRRRGESIRKVYGEEERCSRERWRKRSFFVNLSAAVIPFYTVQCENLE